MEISMTSIEHFQADDLVILIPVTFDAGAAISSLTGGTAVARAKLDGGNPVMGTATIQPSGTDVVASWPENALIPGHYTVQVRATKDGFTKTLIGSRMTVLPSV